MVDKNKNLRNEEYKDLTMECLAQLGSELSIHENTLSTVRKFLEEIAHFRTGIIQEIVCAAFVIANHMTNINYDMKIIYDYYQDNRVEVDESSIIENAGRYFLN